MAWIFTATDLSYLCCCNQRHLLAVLFIFTIVMGAPHTDFTSQQRQTVHDPDGSPHQQEQQEQQQQQQQHHHHQQPHHHHHHHHHPVGPVVPSGSPFAMVRHFATANNTKVTAQRGGTALLPCNVISQSSALVSWIRRQDFQLLTVGLSTYSSDDRFLVEHLRHLGHWALRIKSVRTEDEGLYECQLSVHPVQSVFVELKVVEAAAEIVGAPDLHIDEGSTLRLECKLQRATENPTFVFWYHEQNMVNFDQLNGFSVTPFQSPTTAGHPAHPLQDELDELARSSAEQGFNLLDDDGFAQRPPQLGQDSIDPFLADSSSSSLILASLAAAAAAALSSSPYHHQHHHQHLDRADLSLEQDEQDGLGTVSSESQDVRRQSHPHLHHQHHLHHNQHRLAMNYSDLMPYSHILTPAPSVLTIKEVHLRHAGNYTCAPSNARPASITVHVLQGEKPAAMQHANRSQLDDGSKPSRSGSNRPPSPDGRMMLLLPLLLMMMKLFSSVAQCR